MRVLKLKHIDKRFVIETHNKTKEFKNQPKHILGAGIIYPTKKGTHHLELFNSQKDHKG